MHKISVVVKPELSPKIENWLMRRDVDYEVDVVRSGKGTKLKIIARFPTDDTGKHLAGIYKKFLEKI